MSINDIPTNDVILYFLFVSFSARQPSQREVEPCASRGGEEESEGSLLNQFHAVLLHLVLYGPAATAAQDDDVGGPAGDDPAAASAAGPAAGNPTSATADDAAAVDGASASKEEGKNGKKRSRLKETKGIGRVRVGRYIRVLGDGGGFKNGR